MSSKRDEPKTELYENFTLQMRGLGNRTVLYQHNVASSLGINNIDFVSVDFMREKGPITAGELSKLTGLATGSVTSLIDRLEGKSFVRRQNDPNDRRKVVIVPLYENKEEVNIAYMPLHKELVELAATYTDEELTLITQFLGKASIVMEEQIYLLSSKSRNKSSSS